MFAYSYTISFLSPTLIERLISIHKLTRDNNVSVKFDPYGFSIKDLHTKRELIRSDSHGDLYLLNFQQSWDLHVSTTTIDLWNQRLDILDVIASSTPSQQESS